MNASVGVRKKLARAKKAKEIIYPTIKIQKIGVRCNGRVYFMTIDSSRRVNERPRTFNVLSSQGVRAEKLVR